MDGRVMALSALLLFCASCMEVSMSFDPSKDKNKKNLVAYLRGDVADAGDCKLAEYVLSSFYKLAGKTKCEEPLLSLTARVEIPFYLPLVKTPSECKRPVCAIYLSNKKNLLLVVNRRQLRKLESMVDKYSNSMTSVDQLKFSVIPKGKKVKAVNVYVGKTPHIYYQGSGNRKLTFSTFMTEYLLHHGSVSLVSW